MGDGPTFFLPEAASTLAPELDVLFYFVYWTSVVIFVAVVAAMTFFVLRYRRRNEHEVPEVVHESRLLEAAWIVVPTVLSLIVFTWGFRGFVKLNVAPPDSYQIQVRAKQWLWEFEYPNGFKTIGEVHVPVDRPIRLLMSSEDVLHSFFVPEFRIKQDVIPNRYTSVWFQVTKRGEYVIECTEYCGTQHSGMLGKVIAEDERSFNEFVQSGGVGDLTPEQYGELLYTNLNCNACHSTDGSPKVGPSFKGLFGSSRQLDDGSSVVADEEYIRSSITAPSIQIVQGYVNVMPATYNTLEAAQLDALVTFIKSIE